MLPAKHNTNYKYVLQICFLVHFILLLSAKPLSALDQGRLFPQTLDQTFFDNLRASKNCERAIFIKIADKECFLYIRASDKGFILRGQLTPEDEKCLNSSVFENRRALFSPLKENGEPLYQQGTAFIWQLQQHGKMNAEYCYIPHKINGIDNNCFICDKGYLEIRLSRFAGIDKNKMAFILAALFSNRATIQNDVCLNRYYLYRDNLWGAVNETAGTVSSEIIFPPLHKATLNKGITDSGQKTSKDCELIIDLLAQEKFLLSQDMRCKLGRVPGFVKINMNFIENTDIGSGQNQMVFLSSGPGINYFDDPWQQPRKNVPCPRLLFHRALYDISQMQVYPTYSIEPEAKGEGRLHKINEFQQKELSEADSNSIIWSSNSFRKPYFFTVEEKLCQNGLTNDKTDLAPGFSLREQFFAGNIVNNEIRVFQAISARDLLTAVIVPQGTVDQYKNAYERKMKNTSPHWNFNCGVDYKKLFVEAPVSTDKGFRCTWLMLMLHESHPALYRVMQRAGKEKKRKAFLFLGDKIAKMAADNGRKFFLTLYFKHYRNLDRQRNQIWLEYLEACRNSNTGKSENLLQQYKIFYQHVESACPY